MTMNVCFFGGEIAPSGDGVYIGGSSVSAVNLARYLSAKGDKIRVCTTKPRDWDDYQPLLQTEWGKIYLEDIHKDTSGALLIPRLSRKLIKVCKREDIDIIHGHSGFSIVSLVPLIAGTKLNIPVVHSIYCPPPKDGGSLRKRLSSPWWTKQTLSRVDQVFAMSNNVANSLNKSGIDNVSTIPPQIDLDTFRPDLSKPNSVSISESRTTIAFIGNTTEEKGLHILIDALGNLNVDEIQFIITTEKPIQGDEQRKKRLKMRLERNNLADITDWLGIIPDMPNLLANIDILVVPFLNTEGPSDYPLVALEAMACNTPVIGTEIGGIPELIGDDRGLLVEPKNSTAIAEAIKYLINSNKSPNSREFISENFSEENYKIVRSAYSDLVTN